MATHKKAYMKRVEIGNAKAEPVAKACERLFKQPLDKAPVSQDIDDKVDYTLRETGETVQIHCRETGNEFIYEQHKIRKTRPGSKNRYRREKGRDTLCKAKYMVMVPGTQDKIHASKMVNLKTKAEEAEQEWLVNEREQDPDMEVYSDRWIAKYEYLCRGDGSQSRHLYTANNGVNIFFKIDEGEDGEEYSKVLHFIPPTVSGAVTRPYRPA